MAINLTSEQILDLMREFGVKHWFYKDLLTELNTLAIESPSVEAYSVKAFEKTTSDFRVEAENQLPAPAAIAVNNTNQCLYEMYGNRCTEAQAKDGFCVKHMETVCSEPDCDNQMTHGCPTELQFVCGAPLCGEHGSCLSHRLHWER